MKYVLVYQDLEANTFGVSISDEEIDSDSAEDFVRAYIRVCYLPDIHSFLFFNEPLKRKDIEIIIHISKTLEKKLKRSQNKIDRILDSINISLQRNR